MSNNVKYVTAGKPKIGGSIYRAPAGTALPTDATTALAKEFVNLGYVSEDGVTYSAERETETIKAWGGDIVCKPQTSFEDSVTMTLIEALNDEVHKTVRGDGNVSGSLSSGLTVKVNSTEDTAHIYVIEQVLNGNTLFRTVLPSATVTSTGEVTYSDGDVVGYEITLSCLPDSDGNTHYEYYQTATE